MLHRRLLYDDGKGVAEALNETVCVGNDCRGLAVQGKYYIRIDPLGEGAKWHRTYGQGIHSPLLLAFTEVTEQNGNEVTNFQVSKSSRMDPTYSHPDNVVLLTLLELEDGNVLLRLAHLYEDKGCMGCCPLFMGQTQAGVCKEVSASGYYNI
ncbi:putative alpha-mannosidase At5g13980 isoform X2 [Bidens hawaiensis]|uniref:putative alpha-mannosidase At5g13980 isoform X2 n=1 Tax=Bidens hawaiensis TaxID=980011 RepID=UPI00404A3CB7